MLRSTNRTRFLFLTFILFSKFVLAQPANDNCNSPITITPGTICSDIVGNLYQATNEGTKTSLCGTTYDIWYTFTTPSNCTSVDIDAATIAAGGNDITSSNTFLEGFSGTNCSVTLIGTCTPIGTTLSLTGLTPSTTYKLRIFANTNPNSNSGKWDFNICITYTPPPANDDCAGAVTLTDGNTNSAGTVWNASASSGIPVGCASGNPDDDVWYKFTPSATDLTVSLDAIGTNLSASGARLQLFSGACGGLTSVACGNTSINTTVTSGIQYYIRVYSAGTGSIGGTSAGSTFSITATATAPPAPPVNDECSGAITLISGVTNTNGTVWLASASSGIPTGCATGDPDDDVWYSFTTTGVSLSVTLNPIGSNLASSGARLQLFSGTCGSLVSVACGTTSMSATVTNSTVYYIRVYSAGTGSIGGVMSGSAFSINATTTSPPSSNYVGSRMKEVFKQTILSPVNALNDPWEITYGPDDFLWITEAKGYKVYRMDPKVGSKTTVLDLSSGSTWLTTNGAPAGSDTLAAINTSSWNGGWPSGTATNPNWPQGGLAGLALHPQFLDGSGTNDYVYVTYVHRYLSGGGTTTGVKFRNKLVRFTYNASTQKLSFPVILCDTLPGSNDHNSQRLIIAPVGGINYLFMAEGDMGAGQFGNRDRVNKAQNPASYEGKILRFNLVSDGDAGGDAWIPNNNPYGANSAVWSTGIRNNQGFAYDAELDILYGTSHGPFSDDEINIIEPFKNYGHPMVIGFAADGNYNGTTTSSTNTSISAGAPFTDNSGNSSIAPIGNEMTNKALIDANGEGLYKDPLFSAYAAPLGSLSSPTAGTIAYIWRYNPPNGAAGGGWPSEAWSGLDLYTHTLIPGWKKSLVAASLKWGRLVKLRLGAAGITTAPNNDVSDTISYFGSTNRFRDLTFAPGGKDMYVIMDKSTTTSGPSSANPVVPACGGCVQKYTFLGYADNGGKSSIPTSIDVTDGTVNTCNTGTTITIDSDNSNLWVPITGPDGNIMAEIFPNGEILGTVTSSFYKNSGTLRSKTGVKYMDRNITITPQFQPVSPVKIRLYFSKSEFDALDLDPVSGITSINDVKILKNSDACGSAASSATTLITPVFSEAHGANGYMLQANISGFSSFYFSSSNFILPLQLISFKGTLQSNKTTLLEWKTENEINSSHFEVERSIDGINYSKIGTVAANSGSGYSFIDADAANQQVLVLYYRLKIVDIDNSYKYSGIVPITLADIAGNVMVTPNPVVSTAQITINAPVDGKIQWQLLDNLGRVVLQNSAFVRKGAGNSIIIDMHTLSKGAYYINIDGASISEKMKLQKL